MSLLGKNIIMDQNDNQNYHIDPQDFYKDVHEEDTNINRNLQGKNLNEEKQGQNIEKNLGQNLNENKARDI
jgi:hypothetical protein